jgi:uncharacterized protein YehS (DUF1456 family)
MKSGLIDAPSVEFAVPGIGCSHDQQRHPAQHPLHARPERPEGGEIVQLADPGFVIAKDDVHAFLLREDMPGYLACGDDVLAHFLDGLIIHRRGRDERLPARPVEKRISNNVVLKKLRVAFELKDVDMHQVFADAGFPVSKPELSALFRQPGHGNFRACGDQLLRNFLKGLTLRVRGACGDALG